MARTASTGKAWSRSHAAACGAISASANVAHDRPERLLLVVELEVHGVTLRGADHLAPSAGQISVVPETTPLATSAS